MRENHTLLTTLVSSAPPLTFKCKQGRYRRVHYTRWLDHRDRVVLGTPFHLSLAMQDQARAGPWPHVPFLAGQLPDQQLVKNEKELELPWLEVKVILKAHLESLAFLFARRG